MERQAQKARAAWAGSGEAATEPCGSRCASKRRRDRVPRLRDRGGRGRGAGAGARRRGGRRAKAGESGAVVVNQTPFYGESGGQVGDTGMIAGEGVRFRVTDTQKKAGDLFVHSRRGRGGHDLRPGDAVALEVDHARRAAIRAQPLGDASAARGAAPGAGRPRRAEGLAGRARPAALRLLAPEADDAEEIEQVEDIANDVVLQNAPVTTRLMALDDARDVRRRGAVRREVRRRGARRRDGRRPAATRSAGRSSCAAAPMCGAPATSA